MTALTRLLAALDAIENEEEVDWIEGVGGLRRRNVLCGPLFGRHRLCLVSLQSRVLS